MIRGIEKISGILILLFLLSACADDNDIDVIDEDLGRFQVTISGDVNEELEGNAIFSQYVDDIDQPEEFFFTVFLEAATEAEGTVIWFARGGELPEEDTYPVHDMDEGDMDDLIDWVFEIDHFLAWMFDYVFVTQTIEFTDLFFSEEGSITLEVVDMENVAGTFEFSAIGYSVEDPEQEIEVLLIGEFNAVPGEVPIIVDF